MPTIYAPDESTNFLHITYDDDSAQKLLFDTLKQFICIDSPAEVLKVRGKVMWSLKFVLILVWIGYRHTHFVKHGVTQL